jgi:hypothetical protein
MRKVTEERNNERKKKERFERAAQRFGVINRYEDIPQKINEPSKDELNDYRKAKFSKTAKMRKSDRFGPEEPSDRIMSKTDFHIERLGLGDHKTEEALIDQRIKEREEMVLLEDLMADLEIKKKLIKVHGARVPLIYKSNLQKLAKEQLKEFHHPIDEERNEELNKELQTKYQIKKARVYDYDFDATNAQYIQTYTRFLREQQNCDGLRKYNIKLRAELKAVKKLLLKLPKLDEPKIFNTEDPKRMRRKGNVSFLISKQSLILDHHSKLNTKEDLIEDEHENELMEAALGYKKKMDSVKNELAKYDIGPRENDILGEVGRYLKQEKSLHQQIEDELNESESLSDHEHKNALKKLHLNKSRKNFRVTFDKDVKDTPSKQRSRLHLDL